MEAEAEGSWVQSQPRLHSETLSQKKKKKQEGCLNSLPFINIFFLYYFSTQCLTFTLDSERQEHFCALLGECVVMATFQEQKP
jgi:hypothetical protein